MGLRERNRIKERDETIKQAVSTLQRAGIEPDAELRAMYERYIQGEVTSAELVASTTYKAGTAVKGEKISLANALVAAKQEWPELFWEGPNAEDVRQVMTMARIDGLVFTKEELAIWERVARGEMTTDQVRAYAHGKLKFH